MRLIVGHLFCFGLDVILFLINLFFFRCYSTFFSTTN
eukprot:UN18279